MHPDYAQTRYTCKAYDPSKTIDDETLNAILESLRLSPSSINIQPWHFLVAKTQTAKERLACAVTGDNAYNLPKILNASCVLVLCTKTQLDQTHLDKVIASEEKAGRFADDNAKNTRKALCQGFFDEFSKNPNELLAWAENQTFIALGHLLLSAQTFGVQATPIGGYDRTTLDNELNLAQQHLKSSVIVALGYADENDFNRQLPKARLDFDDVFSTL